MINENDLTLNISKWLNNYIIKNKLEVETVAEQLECSIGFLNMLLDYEKKYISYKEQLKVYKDPSKVSFVPLNVSMDFITKFSNTYNIKIEEIIKEQ